MSRFRNVANGVVVSVHDSKDERFRDGYELVDTEPAPKKRTTRKASSSKSDN